MAHATVRIGNGNLDSWQDDIVVRGIIDPSSLRALEVADYQREVLSELKIRNIMKDMPTSRVPDVELSFRGMDYRIDGDTFVLNGEVYIVDGQQRITAAKRLMDLDSEFVPHIGAIVHFGHNEEWERARFNVLNLAQTKLSPNVTLRNMRHELMVVQSLYHMTTSTRATSFVLNGKVSWNQAQKRNELMTAVMFFKTIGMLHSHIGAGRATGVVELAKGLQDISTTTGTTVFRDNVRRYFEVIDEAWGVQHVAYVESATQLKLSFMLALAKLFSSHTNFWEGERLVVDSDAIRKLALFKMNDPTVATLSSSSGKAIDHLYLLMVEHYNSGRRTKKLAARNGVSRRVTSSASEE